MITTNNKRLVVLLSLMVLFTCATPARADNRSSIGIEGFYDAYSEPGDVRDNSEYGSVTGTYVFNTGPGLFGALDGRLSIGTDHYSSPDDGTSSGSPQYEGDFRARIGNNFGGDTQFSPYIGLGTRIFEDASAGTVTTGGALGYDRRIYQVYLPVGVTWQFGLGNEWVVVPTTEFDEFLWGKVNSELQDAGGYNINNDQHNGYGLRADFMLKPSADSTWEAGPFVRYWNIQDSSVATDPSGTQWIEPQNTRLQAGVAFKWLF